MKNRNWLSLLLVLVLSLSACSAVEPATVPTSSIENTSQPTAAPTVEPVPAAPSPEEILPLLTWAAVASTADNVEPFDGQSDAAFADAFLYLMLRENTYPSGLIGVNNEGGYKTVDPATAETLYSLYFESGSFPGLLEDGFGVDEGGTYSYMMGDPGDLSPVCTILNVTDRGDGTYQYSVSIAQKYASDGSIEPLGELNIVISRNPDGYFGCKLVSIQSYDKEESVNAYFGRDANEALEQIMPLFESIALSAVSYRESFDGQPSDDFAWGTVYSLLNHHTKDFEGLYIENDDGTISLGVQDMRLVFTTCFAYEYEHLPAVPSDYEDFIAYDAQAEGYTIMHADGEMIDFELTDVNAVQNNLVAHITVKRGDGEEVPYEILGTVSILIDHNLDSQYYNNVLGAQYTAPY